jgi:L-lactate dehydrogenase complex protein LldG
MSTTRERVLERIRAGIAAGGEAATTAAPQYVTQGSRAHADVVALLEERLREYDAEVTRTTEAELPGAIVQALKAAGRKRLLAPTGLPAHWRVEGLDWRVDDALGTAEIEAADGVVTGAFCAIADSGTIALHHTDAEGRRVLTLVPDWHLCVLREDQVVETLPEYFARCVPAPRLATYFSGPSATADIEMTRIKGVHGPRSLHVIIVG